MTSRSVDTLAAELAKLRHDFDDFRSTALGRFPSLDAVAATTGDYPLAHAGRTGGFQDISGSGNFVDLSSAQELRGGMTFSSSNNSITVPTTGTYQVGLQGYFTAGAAYQGFATVVRNTSSDPPSVSARLLVATTSKPDAGDYTCHAVVFRALTAGDELRLHLTGSSTWGTTGYDGAYFTVAYAGD